MQSEANASAIARWDKFAFSAAFNITMLEGTEVVFIVIALGASGAGLLLPASLGAVAALLVVAALGFALHRPLARVPENTLKFRGRRAALRLSERSGWAKARASPGRSPRAPTRISRSLAWWRLIWPLRFAWCRSAACRRASSRRRANRCAGSNPSPARYSACLSTTAALPSPFSFGSRLAMLVLPRVARSALWTGPALFAGLALILIESVLRFARRR